MTQMTAIAKPRAGNSDKGLRAVSSRFVERGGGALTLAVLMAAILAVSSPYFSRAGNLLNLIDSYAPIALVAAGMSFVIVCGQFDLSVAAVFPAAGIVTAELIGAGVSVVVGILAGMGTGAVIGLLNGLIVTRLHIHSFVATLAMSMFVGGGLLAITGGDIVSIDDPLMHALGARSQSVFALGPSVWIAAVVIIAMVVLLARTPIGTAIYAVGGSRKASRIAGLRVDTISVSMFVLSGSLAAIAGILSLARVSGAHVDSGLGLELTAITAVVLGGTSIRGGQGGPGRTIAGVAIIALLANAFNLFEIGLQFQQLAVGLVMLAAIAIDARLRSRES